MLFACQNAEGGAAAEYDALLEYLSATFGSPAEIVGVKQLVRYMFLRGSAHLGKGQLQ